MPRSWTVEATAVRCSRNWSVSRGGTTVAIPRTGDPAVGGMTGCAVGTMPGAELVAAGSPGLPAAWRWIAPGPAALIVPVAVDALVGTLVGARLPPRPAEARASVAAADGPIGEGGGQPVGDKGLLPTSGAVVADR